VNTPLIDWSQRALPGTHFHILAGRKERGTTPEFNLNEQAGDMYRIRAKSTTHDLCRELFQARVDQPKSLADYVMSE
jgi:hypothetical protein